MQNTQLTKNIPDSRTETPISLLDSAINPVVETQPDNEAEDFDSDSSDEFFLVDIIVKHQPKNASSHAKVKKYYIKWEGYPDAHEHTWEPADSIYSTTPL